MKKKYKSKLLMPYYKLPLWWLIIYALTIIFFTIQPWAIRIGSIPVQIPFTALLFFTFCVINNKVALVFVKLFSPFQWAMIAAIFLSMFGSYYRGDVEAVRLLQAFVGVMLAFISAVAVLHPKGKKYMLVAAALAGLASGMVALMQYLGIANWSWARTAYYGGSWKVPSGLEFFPVSFAYSLVGIGIISFISSWARIKSGVNLKLVPPLLAGIVFVIIALSLLLAKSRSGILGVAVGISVIAICSSYLRVRIFSLAQMIVAGALVVSCLLALNLSFISDFTDKAFKASDGDIRLGGAWEIFLPALVKYPWGVSERLYNSAASFTSYSDPILSDIRGLLEQTGGHAPHNILLTTGLFLGLPVLLSLALLYVSIIRSSISTFLRSKHNRLRGYYISIFLAANLGLLVHAWFHNSNIFLGEMRGWIWIGALLAIVRFGDISNGGSERQV